jgi:WD40 repeat protein
MHLTERGWMDRSFIARPLNNPWSKKLHPILAMDKEAAHLAIAAGSSVYLYTLAPGSSTQPTQLRFGGATSFRPARPQNDQRPIDITGFTLPSSGSEPHTAFIGFDMGRLKQIKLPSDSGDGVRGVPQIIREFAHPPELIRSLTCENELLASYTTSGLLSLYSTTSSDPAPIATLHKPVSRGWYTYHNASSNTIAVGSSSASPLLVYALTPTGLSPSPLANLGRGRKAIQRHFAVYGIAGAPPGFPGGSSDQILISSWYDGKVRVHDLRDAARGNHPNSSASNLGASDVPTPLFPCQVLYDPWTTTDAKYSVSAGGPGGACIASGSANNSVICLWDVRQPQDGWSIYAPGNDRSPIYSLKMDYSRIWSANQARACVIDFGPGVSLETYPILRRMPHSLPPKPDTRGLDYLAMYYSHRNETTFSQA